MMPCLQCGQPLERHTLVDYCSARCASLQLATLRELLNSTPQNALSLPEWHDLGSDLASDLERLAQLTVAP